MLSFTPVVGFVCLAWRRRRAVPFRITFAGADRIDGQCLDRGRCEPLSVKSSELILVATPVLDKVRDEFARADLIRESREVAA